MAEWLEPVDTTFPHSYLSDTSDKYRQKCQQQKNTAATSTKHMILVHVVYFLSELINLWLMRETLR